MLERKEAVDSKDDALKRKTGELEKKLEQMQVELSKLSVPKENDLSQAIQNDPQIICNFPNFLYRCVC